MIMNKINSEAVWLEQDVTPKKIKLAVEAIKSLTAKDKKDLLDDSSSLPLFVVIAMFKIPPLPDKLERRPLSIKLPVPHDFRKDTQILLITQDTKKVKLKGDWNKSITRYENLLVQHKARDLVSQIMPLHQLRIEYKDYEAKKNLSKLYDFVLCDDTVLNRVPLFLGKHFYGKNKKPVAVNLKAKNLKRELQKVLRRAYLNMDLNGTTSIVQVGNIQQDNKALTANIWAAVKHIGDKIPGSFINIQSLYIKTKFSKSIPIYVNLASVTSVPIVYHPTKLIENTFVVDELPSGGYVKVYRDGTALKISDDKYKKYLVQQAEGGGTPTNNIE